MMSFEEYSRNYPGVLPRDMGPNSSSERILRSGYDRYQKMFNPTPTNQMGFDPTKGTGYGGMGLPPAQEPPSAARARELIQQGRAAEGMAMLKASAGLEDTSLKSNDAREYLSKTGDQAGAEQILKGAVGLPTQEAPQNQMGADPTRGTGAGGMAAGPDPMRQAMYDRQMAQSRFDQMNQNVARPAVMFPPPQMGQQLDPGRQPFMPFPPQPPMQRPFFPQPPMQRPPFYGGGLPALGGKGGGMTRPQQPMYSPMQRPSPFGGKGGGQMPQPTTPQMGLGMMGSRFGGKGSM
jgi:hypothetical protein